MTRSRALNAAVTLFVNSPFGIARTVVKPKARDLDRWIAIEELRQADLGSKIEVAMRYCLVLMAAVALYYASGFSIYLTWGVTYFVGTAVLYTTILNTTPDTAFERYPVIFAMNCITSAVYAFAPMFIWITSDGVSFRAIAMCALIGLGMFNLKRHRRWSAFAVFDCVWTVLVWTTAAAISLTRADTAMNAVLIGLGATGVAGYYVLAQANAINDRTALRLNRESALKAQKLSAIDQVTSGVAHDFNNILTAIQGNIELAELSRDPIERAELLAQAKASTVHASKVVSQMRAYVGKSRMQSSTISLDPFLERFRTKMNTVIGTNMSFEQSLRPHDLTLYCDETLLETALINLVENGQEAMAPEGGKLRLKVMPCTGDIPRDQKQFYDNGFVQFILKDEGPGVLEHDMARVTDPFYSTKPAGNGSGLGLSMVSGFADQAGGALHLRNLLQGGFEAILILPQKRVL